MTVEVLAVQDQVEIASNASLHQEVQGLAVLVRVEKANDELAIHHDEDILLSDSALLHIVRDQVTLRERLQRVEPVVVYLQSI